MPDKDTLARVFIARVGDLDPGPGSTHESLEALRFALADSLGREPGLEDAPEVGEHQLAAAMKYFDPERAKQTLRMLGVRGRFTLERVSAVERLTGRSEPAVFGMRRTRGLGPFLDATGHEVWFNFYGSAAARSVYVPGLARPVLVMTSARLPNIVLDNYGILLDPGTVWVLAQTLDSSAPADGYVGFAVDGGSVELPMVPSIADDRLTLAASGRIDIALTLTAPAALPAGTVCAHGSVDPPEQITLTLFATPRFSGMEGNLVLKDTTIEMHAGQTVAYDSEWAVLAFKSLPDPARLNLASIAHPIAGFSGDVDITGAAWAVPVTRPADAGALGAADPAAAGWLLHLASGGGAEWPDSGAEPIPIDAVSMLVSAGRLVVRSTTPAPASRVTHEFGLWRLAESGQPLPVTVRTEMPLQLSFVCDTQLGQFLSLSARASIALDRPVSALGNPPEKLDVPVHLAFSQNEGLRRVALLLRGPQAGQSSPPWPLVLENGFFHVSSPKFTMLTGTLRDGGELADGRVSIHLDVHGFLPTLPDPYVTNVHPHGDFGRGHASGALVATIEWSANEDPRLTFRGSPGTGWISRIKSSPREARPVGSAEQSNRWEATERATALSRGERARDAIRERVAEEARVKDAENLELLNRHAVEADITFGEGIRLLDVSTHRHQVGVQLRGRGEHVSADTSALTVTGMQVKTPLAGVQVIMLPQVQWEPVTTLDPDQDLDKFGYFPTPLASADDGGATLVGSRSVELAPVIPDLALDSLLGTFDAGEPVGIATTFPFGIKAVLALRPGPIGDRLTLNEASYPRQMPLRNALQLSALASGGVGDPWESPSFAGAVVQLLNGVDLVSGLPEGISVLGSPKDSPGSVETMFNNEFAAARPRVPVTRFDLSGYGGSMFSDWMNPYAMFAEASKVQFSVLVGRTALEIVKFNSVLYPWGIRVTRMVTVERRKNAGVIRRDTGWEAESDGLFDFRYKDKATMTMQQSPYAVHPGIFRGLFAVRNIRPAPDAAPITWFISSTGATAEVLAYHFDCDVALDDGTTEIRTPAQGMTGFLHIRPVGDPLTPVDLAGLFAQQSAIGGPVDTDIAVGVSGLRVRALRVEVDAAGTGVPELVAAVRCSPRFAPNGAWSVIRQPGPAGSGSKDAETVLDGAPLIREGGIRYLPGTVVAAGQMLRPAAAGPYRFADAGDLFAGAFPKRDYGFLQTVATHAFLFRRPRIAAGETIITSDLTPLFADIYARGTSESLFPPTENAIELRDRPYVLAVNPATGRFRLDPTVSLPAPRADLALGDGVEQTMRLVYANTHLSLTITEDGWAMDMPALVTWNGFPDLPELIGVRSRLSGSSSGRSMISEIDSLVTDFVETVLSFIPGMKPRQRPPDIELAATNLAGADKFEARFFYEPELGPIKKFLEFKAFGSFISGREDPQVPVGPPVSYFGVEIGFEVEGRVPWPPPPLVLVLALEFEVGAKVVETGFQKKTKVFIEIKLYAGFGLTLEIPKVYELVGYVGGGLVIERDKAGWHFGGMGIVKAELKILEYVEISFAGEFVGIGRREADHTVMEFTGVIEVNVSYCFLELEASWDLKFEKSL